MGRNLATEASTQSRVVLRRPPRRWCSGKAAASGARAGLGLLLMIAALFLSGCKLPVIHHIPLPSGEIPLKYCFNELCDPKERPHMMKGRDVSPPTQENVARWQAAGFFRRQSLEQVQTTFKEKGYRWNDGKFPCNCECVGSRHVAEGGMCIEAPVRGTRLYQSVVVGSWVSE